MNTRPSLGSHSSAATLQLHVSTNPSSASVTDSMLMTCEVCDLAGGPFPLAEAAAAHKRMELGEHMGKLVLHIAD